MPETVPERVHYQITAERFLLEPYEQWLQRFPCADDTQFNLMRCPTFHTVIENAVQRLSSREREQ